MYFYSISVHFWETLRIMSFKHSAWIWLVQLEICDIKMPLKANLCFGSLCNFWLLPVFQKFLLERHWLKWKLRTISQDVHEFMILVFLRFSLCLHFAQLSGYCMKVCCTSSMTKVFQHLVCRITSRHTAGAPVFKSIFVFALGLSALL